MLKQWIEGSFADLHGLLFSVRRVRPTMDPRWFYEGVTWGRSCSSYGVRDGSRVAQVWRGISECRTFLRFRGNLFPRAFVENVCIIESALYPLSVRKSSSSAAWSTTASRVSTPCRMRDERRGSSRWFLDELRRRERIQEAQLQG